MSIPKSFYSDSENQPFKSCKVCGNELNDGTPYSIEKAMKRVDDEKEVTLFEIAICMGCAEKQSKKMSAESQAYMRKVMGNQDYLEKRNRLWERGWQDQWKAKCFFTDNPVKINEEYHIVGNFINGEVMDHLPPFLMGQAFMEEVQKNLSAETKEEMDRFGKQFLGSDPTLQELLGDYTFVLV